MKHYKIECGNVNGIFSGRNQEYALRNAIRKLKPKALPILFRFKECTDDGVLFNGVWKYQDTECVLKGYKF